MKNFPDRLNGNWLIVKPLPKEEETVNGIVIAASVNADLTEAEVKMRSENIKDAVSVGEKVLFPSTMGLGQIVGGEVYLWLEIHQIWAISVAAKPKKDKGDAL